MAIKLTTLNPVAGVSNSRPRASVVVTKPLASVSAQLLAVATSATVAGATVTAVVPVSSLSHITLVLNAALDTSGRFRYITELAVVLDSISLQFDKPLTELMSLGDSPVLSVDKPASDSFELVETFTKLLTYIRSFADEYGLNDAQQLQVAKALQDSFNAVDFQSRVVQKSLNDGVAMNDLADLVDGITFQAVKSVMNMVFTGDVQQFAVSKSLKEVAQIVENVALSATLPKSDSVAASDAVSVQGGKTLFESQSLSDASKLAVAKALTETLIFIESFNSSVSKPLADNALVTDALAAAFIKALTDGVGINDAAETTDGLNLQAVKSFSNVAFAADVSSRLISTGKSDVASASDVGSLVNQGYCDPTYFAEDYVGDARSF